MYKKGFLLGLLSLVSCNAKLPKDINTLITYEIKGMSSEGAEAKVNYVNNKISKSITCVYGETGQVTIIYEFEKDKIKVSETKCFYKVGIENVKSEEDMQLDYKVSYFIDFKGNVIGDMVPNRIDIFQEFRKAVPFELEKKK